GGPSPAMTRGGHGAGSTSGRPGTANVQLARFADQPDFGTLTWPDREPMVALNTMLATDGAALHVPTGLDGGIVQLVSLSGGQGDFHPRHSIRLAKGARLTVVEISAGHGAYLLNTVAEIHVAQGAHLTHIRLQDEADTAFHVSTTYADVETGGTYDSFTLNLGARLSRTEVHAQLSGPGAITHLNAVQILAGSQHADFTTVVSHTAPSCSSRQTVKNVLADRSRGVFQGKIEVARHAQKTDGYQMNQALLLSPYAEVDSKPELEIFADDVKCSHGATVGELDAEQMFYLRSRGIPDAEAKSILVRAFLAEALDAVADETIRGLLETAVEQWWERQKA
ncbi:MAG TPA: Fe-S cluster assembly protein SufD, partial [Acetobacteraceae bacterium]|nr:Fe-S cluster assembly protein SufD [Acetobacteraceae bacterium]